MPDLSGIVMNEDNPVVDYPRPWFYRPEFFLGFFIFPPVWSFLALRSPWNRNVLVGGVAWAILIVGAVLAFRWVRNGSIENLVIFIPGVVLTVVTQVQWSVHRARHGPPPALEDDEAAPSTVVDQTHDQGKAPTGPGPSLDAKPIRPSARRRSRVRRARR